MKPVALNDQSRSIPEVPDKASQAENSLDSITKSTAKIGGSIDEISESEPKIGNNIKIFSGSENAIDKETETVRSIGSNSLKGVLISESNFLQRSDENIEDEQPKRVSVGDRIRNSLEKVYKNQSTPSNPVVPINSESISPSETESPTITGLSQSSIEERYKREVHDIDALKQIDFISDIVAPPMFLTTEVLESQPSQSSMESSDNLLAKMRSAATKKVNSCSDSTKTSFKSRTTRTNSFGPAENGRTQIQPQQRQPIVGPGVIKSHLNASQGKERPSSFARNDSTERQNSGDRKTRTAIAPSVQPIPISAFAPNRLSPTSGIPPNAFNTGVPQNAFNTNANPTGRARTGTLTSNINVARARAGTLNTQNPLLATNSDKSIRTADSPSSMIPESIPPTQIPTEFSDTSMISKPQNNINQVVQELRKNAKISKTSFNSFIEHHQTIEENSKSSERSEDFQSDFYRGSVNHVVQAFAKKEDALFLLNEDWEKESNFLLISLS
jgi:hypothetical protein